MRLIVPVPTEGLVTPVAGSVSGVIELKFHCVMTVAAGNEATINKQAKAGTIFRNRGVVMTVIS
jgi:hypothetical protein